MEITCLDDSASAVFDMAKTGTSKTIVKIQSVFIAIGSLFARAILIVDHLKNRHDITAKRNGQALQVR